MEEVEGENDLDAAGPSRKGGPPEQPPPSTSS